MKASDDVPIYNLKAVVQETGLKPDTLRAWERRYGLPTPQRTDSGHRLYSANDIELLKWLLARQEEGMSISRATELWRRLEAEGPHPLQQMPAQISDVRTAAPNTQFIFGEGSDTLGQLRDGWITSCLNFDEQRANQIVTQAFALFPVEQVCQELLQKGLAVIGQGWYEKNITVQQEHFASALAIRRLEALLSATPAPTRSGRILIGCPPDEDHTLAPLLLTLLLRRRSWDIIFLGANVPIQDFILTVQTAKPQLVVLSAHLLYTAVGLRELGELIYEARVPLGYGGPIFTALPTLQKHITGHYLGDRLDQAIGRIEQLMVMPRLATAVAPPSPPYTEALEQFRRHQAQIETEVWRLVGNQHMSLSLLRQANINFGRDIIAALALGDIHHLGIDLPWVTGLLKYHYQMPASVIMDYLQAYLKATETVLNGHSPMLVDWLKQILQKGIVTT